MLKSLTIRNYESWKSATFHFDPGVNIIIGPSDSGKSGAILRALLWPIFNRPAGDDFRSDWGGDTIVDIELEKHTISREKGKENLYRISGFKNPFKAIGQSVPEEVSSLLNISDVNIRRQMDAPFLLGLTSGEVGRALNQAIQLDVINTTQSNIASTLRQERNLLLNAQSTIANKQKELKEYDWLSKAEGRIVELEHIASQIAQIDGAMIDLNKTVNDINAIDISLKEASLILVYDQEIDSLLKLNENIGIQNDLFGTISSIVENIITIEQQIELSSKLMGAEKQIDDLIEERQNYRILKEEKSFLSKLIEDIYHIDRSLHTAEKDVEEKQKEFEMAMPDTCPLFDVQCEHIDAIKAKKEI
jgi:DNA repair ATPase RecN